MNVQIKQNKNNIKRKEDLLSDSYFNSLLNITIKYSQYEEIHEFIKDLLTMNNEQDYKEYLDTFQDENNGLYEKLYEVYNLFSQWKPWKLYNMSECRGMFFEELILKYLKPNNMDGNIYTESKMIVNDYSSHTWDIIVELNKYFKLYECKFSSYHIKRKHVDKMVSLKNKLQNSKIYLTVYENKSLVEYTLKKLRQDTNKEKYENNLKKINIFTLENIIRGDAL
ncbi:MAG: hypothetical protein BZ136_09350 [Methanosphaera sp. rholeuAM74]|nr:MAG: hypothetical protein BZ136_09350 [Methanosphaera sp. rholeuAM74]